MTTPVNNAPVHQILSTLNPMLADSDSGLRLADLAGTHVFDTKLDGVRAIAAWDGHVLTMRNRNNRTMDNYLDLELAAADLPGPVILDGEIITLSGKFQDAAWRDKQNGANAITAMRTHPAHFIAFDILWHPDLGDVRHLPYSKRRELLVALHLEHVGGGRWDTTVASTDHRLYDIIRAGGGEGVIAKRLTATYSGGRRKDWLKFKSTFSVSCLATGYEPGKGARTELGAIFLSVIDGSKAVAIGKAGSGFTLPESLEMKRILDNVTGVADLPVVEIKCLGITRDGKLRQPVYLGIRTDMTITDASASQLDSLPVT